ncbi:hypothetical protein FF1_001998 [Malus domestica]
MHTLDFFDLLFVQFVAEAHQNQEAEHGILEVVDHPDDGAAAFGVGLRLGFEAVDEDIENPFAGVAVGFDAGRVKDFGGEVAAEEAPSGAVDGGADVVLVAGDVLVGGQGRGAVGEHGAVLD